MTSLSPSPCPCFVLAIIETIVNMLLCLCPWATDCALACNRSLKGEGKNTYFDKLSTNGVLLNRLVKGDTLTPALSPRGRGKYIYVGLPLRRFCECSEKIKTKSTLTNWTSGTFSLKLIFLGAFVVMASKCSLVRIRSLQRRELMIKDEIAAVMESVPSQ